MNPRLFLGPTYKPVIPQLTLQFYKDEDPILLYFPGVILIEIYT